MPAHGARRELRRDNTAAARRTLAPGTSAVRVRTLPPKRSIMDSSSSDESPTSTPARVPGGADVGASAEGASRRTATGQPSCDAPCFALLACTAATAGRAAGLAPTAADERTTALVARLAEAPIDVRKRHCGGVRQRCGGFGCRLAQGTGMAREECCEYAHVLTWPGRWPRKVRRRTLARFHCFACCVSMQKLLKNPHAPQRIVVAHRHSPGLR